MTAKLVLRVFAEDGSVLGWAEHHAAVRGDGMLRANGPVTLFLDRAGKPTEVSIHWADVHVETRVKSTLPSVAAGTSVLLYPHDAPMMVVGKTPGPLPAVTTKGPVDVGVPLGTVGARG